VSNSNGQEVARTSNGAAGTGTRGEAEATVNLPAGTYTVTASFAGDNQYAASSTTFGLTVNKAVLTVKADNKSRPTATPTRP
jgi:hypothetical protein